MDIPTAAYIAGIMDGEGCFLISKFRSAFSPIGFQFKSQVELTMCDLAPMKFIADITGMNLRIRKARTVTGRIPYVLVWHNSKTVRIINDILPYLIGKRDQAEILLDYEANIAPGRGRTYKQVDLARCEEARQKLKDIRSPPRC